MTATTHSIGTPATGTARPAGEAGLLGRLRLACQTRMRRRRQLERLARMDDALLLDIGIAEEEIWRVRRREDFIPRAWLERRAREIAA